MTAAEVMLQFFCSFWSHRMSGFCSIKRRSERGRYHRVKESLGVLSSMGSNYGTAGRTKSANVGEILRDQRC